MSNTDVLGYLASSAVLMTFLMTRMTALRVVAIASNLLFIAFGFVQHIYPVFFLHVVLLPVNVWRLLDIYGVGVKGLSFSPRVVAWFAAGMFAAVVSASTVMAFGVPEYDNLAHAQHASFSFSRCNPVKNAFRVIRSAKAHVFAEDRPAHSAPRLGDPLSI